MADPTPLPPPSYPETTISTLALTRVVIVLIACWTTIAGLVLLAFHGASSGALGAGVEDEAGQRLLGIHLLLLVPAYLLLAWRPERYRAFLWLPYATQLGAALVVGYNLLSGDTEFGDGILAFAVGLIFVVLLAILWITEQRTLARLKMEADESSGSITPGAPSPGPQA